MIKHGSAFDKVAGIFIMEHFKDTDLSDPILPTEEWRDIRGYEGYQASTLGNIRSIERSVVCRNGKVRKYAGGLLTTSFHPSGSLRVNVSKDGLARQVFVHQLVALAFFDEYELDVGMQVRHIYEIEDNSPSNLKVYANSYTITGNGKKEIRYNRVRYDNRTKKYFTSILVAGKEMYLGMFNTAKEAYKRYLEAEAEYKDINVQYKIAMKKIRSDKKRNRIMREKKMVSARVLKERVKVMKDKWAKRVEDKKNGK